MNILRIDSSARSTDSVGRELATRLIERLDPDGAATVIHRDLAQGVSLIDEATIGASFTRPEDRTDEQSQVLAEGQELIEELKAADVLVIAMPIYNFSAPGSLKAWADLVARIGVTFEFDEAGPVGLLHDRPSYLIVTAGSLPVASPTDWATGWLRQFLGFIGITDITVIEAGEQNLKPTAVETARQTVAELALV